MIPANGPRTGRRQDATITAAMKAPGSGSWTPLPGGCTCRSAAAIAFAVEHHLQAGRFSELRRSKKLSLLASAHWPVLRSLALCDIAARGDGSAVTRLDTAFCDAEADAAATIERRKGAPPISGTRVMELTGLAPGPLVGEIRRRVSEWAQDNRIEDRERIEAEVARLAGEDEDPRRQPTQEA